MKPFRQDSVVWVSRSIFGVLFLLTLGVFVQQALVEEMPLHFIALNMLIVAIPLLVFFFAAGLLVEALEQHFLSHHLTRRTGAALRWMPRIGMILFAAFLSLFALDIFGQGYTVWETVVGLTMHLIPTFILLGVLALAWRWPLVGGVTALLAATVFLLQFGNRSDTWFFYLTIIGPPVVIGLMFLADWRLRKEVDSNQISQAG
jgi:hypothetical protein